jgi:biopolymer transport protein TolQ
MDITYQREMDALERHISLLSSIGSIAPFIGLLGMVWEVMEAFQQIAITQNATLASIGPSIAQSLFVTALGLMAAIPATVAYHMLATQLNHYSAKLETFYREVATVFSRHFDNQHTDG